MPRTWIYNQYIYIYVYILVNSLFEQNNTASLYKKQTVNPTTENDCSNKCGNQHWMLSSQQNKHDCT